MSYQPVEGGAALLIDCSIFVPSAGRHGTVRGDARNVCYKKGLSAILQHKGFFEDHNIHPILVDNTFDDIRRLDFLDVSGVGELERCLFVDNRHGAKNKGAGVIRHWEKSRSLWSPYRWVIHLEARQLLKDLRFFERFLETPRTLFTWGNKGGKWGAPPLGVVGPRDPRVVRQRALLNDFYTGFFSVPSSWLGRYVDRFAGRLDEMLVNPQPLLEKSVCTWTFCELGEVEIMESMGVLRLSPEGVIEHR